MSQRILNKPFTPDGRAILLADHQAELDRLLAAPEDSIEYEEASKKLWQIRRSYCDQLPLVRFCLSPFDGLPFDHSIDPYGIDGLWWSSLDFIRPLEYLPIHVVALTGAITLEQPIEVTHFVVKPGPGIPFVVPWVLDLPGVKAVLCPIKIGKHQGWPIIYFRQDGTPLEGGFNTWGEDRSRFMVGEEESGWNEWSAGPEDYDFDLRPWVESGKLLWVPAEDQSGVPRVGLEGFEWLDLTGERQLQLICEGRVMLQQPFALIEWEEEAADQLDQSSPKDQWWQATPPETEPDLETAETERDREEERSSKSEAASKGQIITPPTRVQIEPPQQLPAQTPPPPVHKPGPKFCRSCGGQLKPGAKFCSSCGAKLD